jgi:chemotaxis protein methyltransferase CheR
MTATQEKIRNIEMTLFLEAIFQAYGYDFREYAEASLRRRLTGWLEASGFGSFSEAQARILHDPAQFDVFLRSVTVTVSEMFRDPGFFKALREQVAAHFKTYPFLRIWNAGCSTGEEAYSMAILMHEEGFSDRYLIYATDINQEALRQAKEGIYHLKDMQNYTQNYQKSGGSASFSDYYTARYDHAALAPFLRERIVFASHNLATDAGFGEMHILLCRNVLIYFKQGLKDRVLTLFDSTLIPGGILCLGLKETLAGRALAGGYEELAPRMRIYRKKYG